MIDIVIGTGSRYKANAVKKALHELDFEFTASNVEAESGISEQPHTNGETKQGSINRAKHALNLSPTSDIAIGVEFGYEPVGENFHMICWATIAMRDDRLFSEHSSSLELPMKLRTALLNDEDVASTTDIMFTTLRDIERNRIFKQFLTKRRVIYESVINVTLRYLLDQEAY